MGDQPLCVSTLQDSTLTQPKAFRPRLYLDQLPERLSSLEVQNAVVAVSGRGGGGEAGASGEGAGTEAGTDAGTEAWGGSAGVTGAGARLRVTSLARLASRIYNVAMMKGACLKVTCVRGGAISATRPLTSDSLVCFLLPPALTPPSLFSPSQRPSLSRTHPLPALPLSPPSSAGIHWMGPEAGMVSWLSGCRYDGTRV